MKKDDSVIGKLRINVGCGQSPTIGWRNFDNSCSLRLSKIPLLPLMLYKAKLINELQYQYIRSNQPGKIEYADILRGLPLSNESAEVFYSSHLLEHLDQSEAAIFCREAMRVLCHSGIIRVAVPDLDKKVSDYIETKDADAFISGVYLCKSRPRSIPERLRFLIVGPRHHQWMYNGPSLCRLLKSHGFKNAVVVEPGKTQIENPGVLDLEERCSESIYVEARKP